MAISEAQQELAFIKKIMEDTQRILIDNGKTYILWSVLAILAIFLKIIKDAFSIMINNLWIYIPILILGWILSYWLKRKMDSEISVKKFSKTILEGIWLGWGIAIPILAIIGYVSGAISEWAIPPIIATIFGCTHYASGIVLQNLLIRYSSIGWWIGAIIMFFWPGEYAVALLGIMIFILQLIPGILLYKKWNNEMLANN